MPKTIRTVIIGGGIAGITQGIRLKQELGDRVHITGNGHLIGTALMGLILEKKGSPGGVWRDSIWPEAGVDVPIHLYTLGDDLEPGWENLYASQPEVLAYWERLIDKYGLRSSFLFNSEYVGSKWDAATQTHTVTVRNVDTGALLDLETEVLISATGPLAKRKFPNVPGLKSFQGAWFHNLDWDGSVELAGKRIAVVGNGSSGVQMVPGLAKLPGTSVTHYIRSGGYFIPKIQRQYSAWEKFAFAWIPGYLRLHRFSILLEHDRSWSIKTRFKDPQRERDEGELLAYLREKAPEEYVEVLTPSWPLATKRPPLDFGWLDSLHRDNVELVSSNLAEVTADGLTTVDGKHREHDIIVYATGSEVASHGVGANVNLYGEDGLELEKYWTSLGGPQAYAGIAVPHFPNYFIVLGPNALAGSWGYTISRETVAIARIVRELLDYGISSVQPRLDVFEAENKEIKKILDTSTLAVTRVASYWRAPTGRITVNSPLSGIGLFWKTLSTRWADWEAVRVVPDANTKGKGRLQKIDVAAIKRRRRAIRAAIALALGAVLYRNRTGIVAFVHQAVQRVRDVLKV